MVGKLRKSLLNSFQDQVIFFILLTGLFSRGLWQVFLPKSISMALQLLIIVSCLFLFTLRPLKKQKRAYSQHLLLALVFLFFALLSALLTSFTHLSYYWIVYLSFTFISTWICLSCLKLSLIPYEIKNMGFMLCLWGWILFLCACLEQIGVFQFPGASRLWIIRRPASISGSMLHYPLLISMLGFVVLTWYQTCKDKRYALSAYFFLLAPFVALSRSGVFISAFSFVIYTFLMLFRNVKKVMQSLLVISLTFFFLYFVSFQSGENAKPSQTALGVTEAISSRIFNATDVQASGNQGRVASWKFGWNKWLSTHLILGEETGHVTNSTQAFFGENNLGKVTESGLLQQLINFGFLGTLLYYLMICFPYFFIEKEHYYLKSVYISCIIQTLFYQSIEVLSFFCLLMFIPWFSKSMKMLHERKKQNPIKSHALIQT